MCSTGQFQFRWLIGFIYSSCYYHHRIGSINLTHCYHIFPWLCAWDVGYIIFGYLLHWHSDKTGILFSLLLMMSSNSRMRFGLQITFVCLYITSSHYHHCVNLSEDNELINACQIYFVECVSEIKHILSVIHYTIYGAVCLQFTHFPCGDWEDIYFVLSSSSNRKYELLPIVKG